MANDASADDVAYVTALVRAHDLPRYYAALFAPREARDALLAIYGFAAEIARVPNQVREPTLGAIRLKWWSEALAEAVRRDGAGETPALRAAAGAIVRHALPLAAFEALIEARSADLYSDPPATLTDLEGRMGETESALFQMAAIVLGAAGTDTADAAGHAGVAYGIARGLATFAPERARGRTILPEDVLAQSGLAATEIFASTPPGALPDAVARLTEAARGHLAHARALVAELDRPIRPAFLPLAAVPPLLARIERLGPAIAERHASVSDLEGLLRIGLAHLTGLGRG